MWDSDVEGFPVYRTRNVPLNSRSLQDDADCVLHSNRQTRFQKGELGDCWLAAAIESLRQENNCRAFEEVVQINGNDLEFRFWHIGTKQRTITLASDAVPTSDGDPIFMHNVGGNEYWGILLEKAYAKWVGSYENLEGGFWSDAIQSFTGGVVERIKILQEDGSVTDNLFDIMKTSWSNGSSLCCIKKEPGEPKTYHAFCIIGVHEEDDNRSICVHDPSTQVCDKLTYDDFTQNYHRLDMCHTNWDNLRVLQGRNTAQSPWESEQFLLQFNDGSDKFDIILTGTDDDQEDCILAVELIQDIKPGEGEELSDVSPWNAMVRLEMDVNDDTFDIKFPQEARCFILKPGPHHIKVSLSPDEDKHRDIYVRLLSKSSFKVEKKLS